MRTNIYAVNGILVANVSDEDQFGTSGRHATGNVIAQRSDGSFVVGLVIDEGDDARLGDDAVLVHSDVIVY